MVDVQGEIFDTGHDKAGGTKAPTIIIWGFNDPTAPYFLGVNLMETVAKVVDRSELHISTMRAISFSRSIRQR